MRKFLLFISIIFLSFTYLQAQDLNQVDSNGNKQGKWRKTYLSGVIKYEGQFRNDKPYGIFKHYYEDAQLKANTTFSDDGIIAHTKSFHENGQPLADGKYINQKRDSTWNFYSDIDGSLVSVENYKIGTLYGLNILYYPGQDQVAEITEYISGKKEGPYLKYFPDGKIMIEGNYSNNQLDGKYTVYYDDGTIEIDGKYLNGIKEGNWDYYDEEGKTISEEDYKEQQEVKKQE